MNLLCLGAALIGIACAQAQTSDKSCKTEAEMANYIGDNVYQSSVDFGTILFKGKTFVVQNNDLWCARAQTGAGICNGRTCDQCKTIEDLERMMGSEWPSSSRDGRRLSFGGFVFVRAHRDCWIEQSGGK